MKTPAESRPPPPSLTPEAQLHEQELVRAFIIGSKRNRLIFLLGHKEKKRRKVVLNSLNHFRDLDLRLAQQVPPAMQSAKAIGQLLQQKGAPPDCYVISDDWSIDGRFMPLKEALTTVVSQGLGTLLSCIPGKLGYFEGEDTGERFILEKP